MPRGKDLKPRKRRKGAYKGRIKINKYWYLYMPGHPSAMMGYYIAEHRFLMEQHLKRYLLPTEDVHHKDDNPDNNDISNIKLLTHTAHAAITASRRRRNKYGKFTNL